MKKTYTQKVHFKIVIEGNYSCGNLWEEELCQDENDFHDAVFNYLDDNLLDYFCNANIILSDLETVEDN